MAKKRGSEEFLKKEAGKAGMKKSKVPPIIQLHLPIARPQQKIC